MGNKLVIEFFVGGGTPPATNEWLRIFQDGITEAIVGNAWPSGFPQDEIGYYRTVLTSSYMQSIERFLTEYGFGDMNEEYGPIFSDSGFRDIQIRMNGIRKHIKWGNHARMPDALKNIETRLREALQDTRQHPVQVIRMFISTIENIRVGESVEVEYQVFNPGTEPIRLILTEDGGTDTLPILLYAAKPGETDEKYPPPLEFYYEASTASSIEAADYRGTEGSLVLQPEETWRVTALMPVSLEVPGVYQLYGFLRPKIEIILDESPFHMDECLIISPPVSVQVEQ